MCFPAAFLTQSYGEGRVPLVRVPGKKGDFREDRYRRCLFLLTGVCYKYLSGLKNAPKFFLAPLLEVS